MRRERSIALLAAGTALLLLGAVGAPSATRRAPKALVTESGPIHAFAQDTNALAWIGPGYLVHVRLLGAKRGAVIGNARQEGGPVRIAARPLALAGARAVWTSYNGGNTLEVKVHSGSPSQPEDVISELGYMPGPPDGSWLGGVAGDGSTLVFGEITQRCDVEWDCRRIDVTGSVRRGDIGASAVEDLPAPFLLATSSGRIALVRAKTPRFYPDIGTPRVAEYAPVEVYDLAGRLLSSFTPAGTPRAIALAWPKLALLFEFVDGTREIELRDARTGGYWFVSGEASFSRVPVTVSQIAVGAPGMVYAVGNAIYLLRAQKPKLVWHAVGTPIGLSIEGKRIAWAENVRGKGRIRSLTMP